MKKPLSLRFWIEAGLSILSGALLVLTLVEPEWIEVIFRVDPDEGSGALEWLIVVALFAITIAFALLARSEWRHHREAAA